MTSRGLKEKDFEAVAGFLHEVCQVCLERLCPFVSPCVSLCVCQGVHLMAMAVRTCVWLCPCMLHAPPLLCECFRGDQGRLHAAAVCV
jgi:hypothetical protein